ncbi:MAG: DUF2807 domain-containing protein [Planctomycetia bacterium]|nr:DUF2807 domain-containing protein [Planctomycetia bacterium]
MICRAFKLCMYVGALAGGALIAWTVFRPTVEGSGVPATEERAIGDVTEVVVSGVGDLTVVQGEYPSLRVTADDNILPLLDAKTSGSKLTFRTTSQYSVRPKTKITYTLTVPRLEAITISGAGNVKTDQFKSEKLAVKLSGAGNANLSNLDCKTLSVSLSGAGTATISGKAEKATLRLSGAGKLHASGLKTTGADVQISGAGTASIWATNDLKARVSGAGNIKYKGTPKLEQRVSGAGTIRAIPPTPPPAAQ